MREVRLGERRRAGLLWGLLGLAWGAVGCASAPPPLVAAPPAPVTAAPPPTLEAEIGGMNELEVARAFDRLARPIGRCIEAGASEVEPLGGHFEVSLRIDRAGKARWAYVSASTLGHRATERCIAEAARAHAWPRPVGGEGLASRSFDIEPGAPSTEWSERHVRGVVRGASAQLAKCKRAAPVSWRARRARRKARARRPSSRRPTCGPMGVCSRWASRPLASKASRWPTASPARSLACASGLKGSPSDGRRSACPAGLACPRRACPRGLTATGARDGPPAI
jgi:hypothetical protein